MSEQGLFRFEQPGNSVRLLLGFTVVIAGLAACSGEIGGTSPSSGVNGGGTPSPPGLLPTGSSGSAAGWYEALKATDCSAPPTAFPSSRVWRLSAAQWTNTVAAAFRIPPPPVAGFPADPVNPISGFSDDAFGNKITADLASAYFDAGDPVATQAATGAIAAFPCLSSTPITAACGQMFAAEYGRRLFRRDLTDAESAAYARALASESAMDAAPLAVATVLKAMLMSPNFLFRTELGDSKPGVVELTQNEIAQMLSYTIADSPPDDQLMMAAAKGQLADPATRQAQAIRLAALPAAQDKLTAFWNEYLALGTAPGGTGLDASLYAEAQNLLGKIAYDVKGSYKDLMTAPFTYADAAVAAVYGGGAPAADGRVALDPKQRAGFMTTASMLVQTAATSQAATVIHRGLLVRERALCETPPPPPPDVQRDPSQIQQAGPNATARQNYELFKTNNPSCNACHEVFQPLGLAFESYDTAGKFRSAYPDGQPIDTSATLTGAGDADGTFASVVEMANKIGASEIGQYCFTGQFAQFAFGRAMGFDSEACTIRAMGDYVRGNGGQLTQMFGSIAAAPTAFRRFHQ